MTNSTTGTSDGDGFTIAVSGSEALLVQRESAPLSFYTASFERARIDSSGRLLVGTSTSTSVGGFGETLIQAKGNFTRSITLVNDTNDTNYSGLSICKRVTGGSLSSGYGLGALLFQGYDGSNYLIGARIEGVIDGGVGTNDLPSRLVFSTTADGASSPTERMRITNSGAFKHTTTGSHVGATNITHTFNSNHNSAYTFEIRNQNNSFNSTHFGLHVDSTTTNGTYEFMRCTMGGVGTKFIILDSGNVQNTNNFYGALSDIKLKENIVDANSQWDDLKAIQVRNYNLKGETGHETHTQLGVVAQEVELISPGLVTESPDRDEDGNDLGTVTKSVNYSVLYMKAVKALQEAMERIETLETANASQAATIAALDARLTALEGG